MPELKDIVLRVLSEKMKYHKDYKMSQYKRIKNAPYIPSVFAGNEFDFILKSTFYNPYTGKVEPKVICIIITETDTKVKTNYKSQNVFVIGDFDYMIIAIEEIENMMNEGRIEAEIWVKREREAIDYIGDFWRNIVTKTVDIEKEGIVDSILPPINFYDERLLIGDAIKAGNNNITSGHTNSGQYQSSISIALNIDKRINKKTIRHELIHYLLALKGYGWYDNDLAFWCYCYIFDGRAYEKMDLELVPIYEKFIKTHDEIIKMKEKIAFPISVFEIALFTFFKDYYDNNMKPEDALSSIDNLKNDIFKGMEQLKQINNN